MRGRRLENIIRRAKQSICSTMEKSTKKSLNMGIFRQANRTALGGIRPPRHRLIKV
jgi:hypothetical protein